MNVKIPLEEAILGHEGPIHEIEMRPPTYDDYLTLGEMHTWVQSNAKEGEEPTFFRVENPETLKAYIAKCLVSPKDPLLLEQGGIKLARKIKETILGFLG